jgi:hypothetical protein
MPAYSILSTSVLGSQVKYNPTTKKLELNLDGTSLKADANGVISVDLNGLNIKVVSDDNGNVLQLGSDGGASLSADKIKQVVGEMVASSTDGIDYDELTKTLRAYLYSFAVQDTNTVSLVFTEDDNGDGENGDGKLTANVKISSEAGNYLEVKPDGLFVPYQGINNNSLSVDASTEGEEKLVSNVDGLEANVALDKILDQDGNLLGYMIKPQ